MPKGLPPQLELELPGTGAPWPYPPEDLYFASGCNHAGEIRGFFEAGYNVGVSAAEIGDEAEAELEEQARLLAGGYLENGTPVPPIRLLFGDTGAFSEVSFDTGRPEVAAPISDAEWRRRLDVLLRMADHWGSGFFMVAPDRVASQEETLARLERYRDYVVRAHEFGANIIVPVQHGALHMLDFWREAVAVLDLPHRNEDMPDGGLIAGITGNKDATSEEQLELFAMGRAGDAAEVGGARFFIERPPLMFHLLGCGPRNPRYVLLARAVLRACPWAAIFSDSCRLTAMTGRPGRDGRRTPRLFTAARDEVLGEGEVQGTAAVKAEALSRALQREAMERYAQAFRRGWRPAIHPKGKP
jgi:hypothetical protein